MKKSKFLIVALISVLMVTGLVLVSCSACPGNALGNDKGACTADVKNLSTYQATMKDCQDFCVFTRIQADGSSAVGKKYSCDC